MKGKLKLVGHRSRRVGASDGESRRTGRSTAREKESCESKTCSCAVLLGQGEIARGASDSTTESRQVVPSSRRHTGTNQRPARVSARIINNTPDERAPSWPTRDISLRSRPYEKIVVLNVWPAPTCNTHCEVPSIKDGTSRHEVPRDAISHAEIAILAAAARVLRLVLHSLCAR